MTYYGKLSFRRMETKTKLFGQILKNYSLLFLYIIETNKGECKYEK